MKFQIRIKNLCLKNKFPLILFLILSISMIQLSNMTNPNNKIYNSRNMEILAKNAQISPKFSVNLNLDIFENFNDISKSELENKSWIFQETENIKWKLLNNRLNYIGKAYGEVSSFHSCAINTISSEVSDYEISVELSGERFGTGQILLRSQFLDNINLTGKIKIHGYFLGVYWGSETSAYAAIWKYDGSSDKPVVLRSISRSNLLRKYNIDLFSYTAVLKLKGLIKGSHIQMWINNKFIDELQTTDTSFPTGNFGLASSGNHLIGFDDFSAKNVDNQRTQYNQISIKSNQDLLSYAIENNWEGNGSSTNPFIISDIFISNYDTAIEIANSDLYFRLENCVIDRSRKGICLNNVSNAYIYNNSLTNSDEYGIKVVQSNNIKISFNYIKKSKNFGILIESSPSIKVTNNSFKLIEGTALSIFSSHSSEIILNKFDLGLNGVYISYSSSCLFDKNNFYNISSSELKLFVSANNTISNNNFGRSGIEISGFSVLDYIQDLVQENKLLNSSIIFFQNTDDTEIQNNASQIILVNCTNINIQNHNFLDKSAVSIFAAFSRDISIQNNTYFQSKTIGIYFHKTNNSVITNNQFLESKIGVSLNFSHNNTISRNEFNDIENGVLLEFSENNLITSNLCQNNSLNGIDIAHSKNNFITNNSFYNTGIRISGSSLDDYIQNEVLNNFVNDFPLIYWANERNKTIFVNSGQIFLINCSEISIQNQNITGTSNGISVSYCNDIEIKESLIRNNRGIGINFYYSSNCMLLNTTFSGNYYATFLEYLNNSAIDNNSFCGNTIAAKSIFSEDIQFHCNSIKENENGFLLESCNNSNFEENFFSCNTNTGLVIKYSESNSIIHNSFHNNLFGAEFFGSVTTNISRNIIYGNKVGLKALSLCNSNLIQNFIYENEYSGISFNNSINNSLISNHFVLNGFVINGTSINDFRQYKVSGNLVNGFPLLFLANQKNKEIGDRLGQIIVINCTWISITNQILFNSSIAINIIFSSNILISDSSIESNNYYGIFILNSHNVTLLKNYINYNGISGVYFKKVTFSNISDNIFNDNNNAIVLSKSGLNSIQYNSMSNNGLCVSGSKFDHFIQINVSNNLINRKKLIYWQNEENRIIPNESGQVILINSINITITNQLFSNISNGIFSYRSRELIITKNMVSHTLNGINLMNSTDCVIAANFFAKNQKNALIFVHSTGIRIFNNSVALNNRNGISMYNSNANNILLNSFFNNYGNAIHISISDSNCIMNNTIKRNKNYGVQSLDSGTNYIMYNNFFDNKNTIGSQAYDNKKSEFKLNYWNNHFAPDANKDGISDIFYDIEGADNMDEFPVTTPFNIEINLLTKPYIIAPQESDVLKGVTKIKWQQSRGFYSQNISYSIYFSLNSGLEWILIESRIIELEYQWSTYNHSNGNNYVLKVVAIDDGGLQAYYVTQWQFSIQNAHSTGFTFLKVLIILNIIFLIVFLSLILFPQTKDPFWRNIPIKYELLMNSNYKFLFGCVFFAISLSILRAWLIDPYVVIKDGYEHYTTHLLNLFKNWGYDIDFYAREPHQFRLIYSLIIAVILLLIPITPSYYNIVFIGQIISIVSFIYSIYIFSKILNLIGVIKKDNHVKILILFSLNPTIVTHIVRFETDIIFLALSFYVLYLYLKLIKEKFTKDDRLKMILSILILLFIREVGVVIIIAIGIHQWLQLQKNLKISILFSFIILVVVIFYSDILQNLLFYLIWSTSTYSKAVEIVYNKNLIAFLDLLLSKIFNPYVLGKNIESLFWAFLPLVIFSIIGLIRFLYQKTSIERKKVLLDIIPIYFSSYMLLYFFIKGGRGLDRFWIPIIAFPIILLPYTVDLSVIVQFFDTLLLEMKNKIKNILNKDSNKGGVPNEFSEFLRFISTNFLPKTYSCKITNATFYFILGSQLALFFLRIVLSLISSGVLPLYR